MQRLLALLIGISACLSAAPVYGGPPEDRSVTPELRDRAVAILRETLDKESEWRKVHAAEFLIALSYPQGVAAAFEAERKAHER